MGATMIGLICLVLLLILQFTGTGIGHLISISLLGVTLTTEIFQLLSTYWEQLPITPA
jgi:hypothetical protein